MESITVERTVAAPIEQVFDWFATTTNYQRTIWVLRARLARPGRTAPYGVDAVRIHTWLIGWFRERITRYDAPFSFDYVVDRSFPPSRHEFGGMIFTEVPGGTHVEWKSTFELRIPLVGPALTRWIGRPIVTRVFGKILDVGNADLVARSGV